ncbi:Helicase, C-terminal [Ostreococcus tauri]|uniref:Helicase, C-terminal n=1 Tax=Ostreococcus tauri TaxID=70448 RepID=A0A090M210_OSTTA|nr:Helicase, C-terminal [Ostreococcus tauri]CEF98270.1 Helicase, C-terminal [Ostreococcus tauri]|eukprot:XP_022839175.1 Helicase, C-terminal [Ostreococcus tauri]
MPLARRPDARARSSDVVAARARDAGTDADAAARDETTFEDLRLDHTFVRALRRCGYDAASPVQASTVPLGRFGCDVLAQAKSGTGKTMAFAIVVAERVEAGRRRTQALALAPTRESATQTRDCVERLIEGFREVDGSDVRGEMTCALLVGGLPTKEDRRRLALQPHVVVGTPGRTRQMMEEGAMACDGIRLLILDEADALLTGTFERDVLFAYNMLPERKQVCAFSATYSRELIRDLERLMRSPQKVMLCESTTALKGVRQFYSLVEETKLADVIAAKEARLLKIFDDVAFHQAVVFVRRLAWGEALAKRLTSQGVKAAFTAGVLPQERRMKVMEDMRNFQLRVLVSTDLTARGVDLTHVNLVVNLDVPPSGATYMHRVGRTGRFGTYGLSVAVLTAGELEQLQSSLTAERGGDIEPLPDVIPSSWYDYELDEDDAELFQTLKEAPIESSEASEEEETPPEVDVDPSDDFGAADFVDESPASFDPDNINGYTIDFRGNDNDVDAEAQAEHDAYWRWFDLVHPPSARRPRYLPPPPGANEHPWFVPPIHTDLIRLPFVSNPPPFPF